MGNKKTLDIIKDLKKNIIFSTHPPKDNEGENQSFWYDSSNNKLYAKVNNKWNLIRGEAPAGGGGGSGDMLKSVYDKNNNGIVDNAELIDGRKIYVMNRPPLKTEGKDGDIWIEY